MSLWIAQDRVRGKNRVTSRTLTNLSATYLPSRDFTRRTHRRASRRPLTFDSLGMWVGTEAMTSLAYSSLIVSFSLGCERSQLPLYPSSETLSFRSRTLVSTRALQSGGGWWSFNRRRSTVAALCRDTRLCFATKPRDSHLNARYINDRVTFLTASLNWVQMPAE